MTNPANHAILLSIKIDNGGTSLCQDQEEAPAAAGAADRAVPAEAAASAADVQAEAEDRAAALEEASADIDPQDHHARQDPRDIIITAAIVPVPAIMAVVEAVALAA